MHTTPKQHLTAAAALATLLVLSGCGTEPGSGTGDGSTSVATDVAVTGVHWSFDSVTVDGRRSAAPAGAHVLLDSKGQAKGSFGCNHFSAKASVAGDTVTVGRATSTQMVCGEPVQNFENALKTAFTGKLKARLADGSLTLTSAGGDTIALSEQPPAPLVGTTWTVGSLTSGTTTTSVPAGTEGRAHLVFGKDGSVRGNLGCNNFTSTVRTEGSELTFGRVATTRKLCTGPAMGLETALLKTVKGTVSYRIEHRTLTLTAPNGTGFAAEAGAAGAGPGTGGPAAGTGR
ncbi:META domain-containing protein [Streptomyces sp. NPDC050856]|uniref:META domain-containing protein n=1 Tax=Streptomyces sp. NPDC050856 TaxID=3154939 RepID=UPI0033D8EBDA